MAIGGERIWSRDYDFIFPVLLVACKNLQCPLVFFTQQELRLRWFVGELQFSGLPLEVTRGVRPRLDLADFLKLEKFHHYYRTGHVASQFCAIYEVKKQNVTTFEAGHTIGGRIELFRDFEGLAKAVQAEKIEHGESFSLDRKGEKVNLQVYYPVFVTSGPLIECYVANRRPRCRLVHRVGYLLRTRVGKKQLDVRIDVVDEAGFTTLLKRIAAENGQIAKRMRTQRQAVRQSLDWAVKRLSRRKQDYRVSYISGET
ncbi:MAG: hypothetical protein AB9869_04845 [Verrucomicrobiia bacterium]